ncbi:ATP-binding cassette domain-containing protein [Streptomyces olivaceus]|uniref:ATP-binding cassette domain-containing protein n=1 Tax=Streptomyces olivaceus TaxID=47716 RepID=UPI001CD02A26|nr:ATP-binding cassette domain-containing protein [Streptomyces olivaceus]MBZ6226737.1 ATP-binding cassette domain-containing protein [Streptomyces olivaceus]
MSAPGTDVLPPLRQPLPPPGDAGPVPAGRQDAIVAEGLTRSFGDRRALAGVDLRAPAGSVLGLLGPNGAGKTTTVRVLTTLLRPDGGRATVAGHDVRDAPEAVRARIGLSGQYAAVDERLTARENLQLVARLYGMSRGAARRRTGELLDRFALTDAADRPSGGFSGGMRRRLDLAGALTVRPAVVFLDEPTTGLDPRGRADTWQAVQDLVADGTTVLLTTQYLEEADQLADSIAVIDHGRVIANGTASELKATVGGERVTLHAAVPRTTGAVAGVLASLGPYRPEVDPRTGRVSVATDHGAAALRHALAELAAAGLAVRDVSLAPPTLDDVFLALTGKPRPPGAEAGAEASEPPTARGGEPGGDGPAGGARRRSRGGRGAHAWRP